MDALDTVLASVLEKHFSDEKLKKAFAVRTETSKETAESFYGIILSMITVWIADNAQLGYLIQEVKTGELGSLVKLEVSFTTRTLHITSRDGYFAYLLSILAPRLKDILGDKASTVMFENGQLYIELVK